MRTPRLTTCSACSAGTGSTTVQPHVYFGDLLLVGDFGHVYSLEKGAPPKGFGAWPLNDPRLHEARLGQVRRRVCGEIVETLCPVRSVASCTLTPARAATRLMTRDVFGTYIEEVPADSVAEVTSVVPLTGLSHAPTVCGVAPRFWSSA
jgi:hypothetical protein